MENLLTTVLIISALVCGFYSGRAYETTYWLRQFEDLEKRIDAIRNIQEYNNDQTR